MVAKLKKVNKQLLSFKNKQKNRTGHELLLFNLNKICTLKSIYKFKKIKMSAGQFREKFNLARNKLCNVFLYLNIL